MLSFQLLIAALGGWLQSEQTHVIAFLREENRMLKARLAGQRLRFDDGERRRLAELGYLGRRVLAQVATLVTPDTILRWHREHPPLRLASVLDSSWVHHLEVSLRIEATGSDVPHKSLSWAHAVFMPVTTQAVSRHRPSSSQAKRWSLISVTSIRFRHVINGSLAFVFPELT